MTIREGIEEREYLNLSPLACKSKDSKRKFKEEPCDFRTDFQRDRDRIIHSKAFRRLKHKTQVYIAPGDHYRMRMTHSLEVAQIARTIARGLNLNEDLTEAAALGHDVGHTPFGHVGEDAMKEILGHFRHNEQSLRVVEYLEQNGEGLNLTNEVKDAILNHSGRNLPSTLEGKIVRISDRIAYLCHDYDDGIRAGRLTPNMLPKDVAEVFGIRPSKMITAMVSDMILTSSGKNDIILSESVQKSMDEFRNFMFETIYHAKDLEIERKKAAYVIHTLYEYFFSHPDKLPEDFRKRENEWGLALTVADYIAGLTDLFAIKTFEDIFIPSTMFGD
ncbi:deoxyguanosinetriphosphate triphosphohydrolase [Anaerosinus sp.]|uniref:deoxyguanosinetriphosphate triphosphohydrolase n=1 Tax=Selenobaculum sp. TaxID=3074374 RepID=UPI0015AC02B6